MFEDASSLYSTAPAAHTAPTAKTTIINFFIFIFLHTTNKVYCPLFVSGNEK